MKRRFLKICLSNYTLPPAGLSTFPKELTVATRVMQSSSNELSTPVSDSAKCKQMKLNTYALIPEQTLSSSLGLGVSQGVCHQSDVKLGGFQSRLAASGVSNHTGEL